MSDPVLNRRDRRSRLATARRRQSWEWLDGPPGPIAAWGRPLPSLLNDLYSVQRYERATSDGVVLHLVIRNHDGSRDVPWAHAQRIKNEIAGVEREAVQIFPPAAEVVDHANLYHLWVLPEGQRMAFGLTVPP